MRYAPILGFVGLLILLASLLVLRHAPVEQGKTPFPTLAFSAMDGKTQWKPEMLKGKVTLFNFFASWCTPCAAEMPELAALKKAFPDVQFYGVAWNDDPITLKKWLATNGNPFRTVWLDPNGQATIALGIKGVPETVVVDANGMVRERIRGPVTPAMRAEMLDALLRDLQAEAAHAQ